MNTICREKPCALVGILIMSAMTVSCKQKDRKKNPLSRLAPDKAGGFAARDRGRTVNRKTVFDVLNGGAEVYLDYGFKSLYVREYEKKRGGKITLYVFDMGRAADAFGIFTHEHEGPAVEIGQDSDYEAGLLRFWKGRYFVSIFAPRQTRPVRDAMLSLGKTVSDRIKQTGRRPAIIQYLPEAGRKERSLRYLHTHQTLMHHLSAGPADILGLSRDTEAVTAGYASGKQKLQALVVLYGKSAHAARAVQKLRTLPAGESPLHARACGRVLLAVFGGTPAPGGGSLFKQLVQRILECKDG